MIHINGFVKIQLGKISCTNKKGLKKVEEIAEEIYKMVNGKILAM